MESQQLTNHLHQYGGVHAAAVIGYVAYLWMLQPWSWSEDVQGLVVATVLIGMCIGSQITFLAGEFE